MRPCLLACALVALLATPCPAGLIVYTDRAAFEARGVAQQFEDFSEFGPSGALLPGNTTLGGVTYGVAAGGAAVYGPDSQAPLNPLVNMITNLGPVSVGGDVEPGHDLLGFDAGDLRTTAFTQEMTIGTNLAVYTFPVFGLPDARVRPPQFYGFEATGPGEEITTFFIHDVGGVSEARPAVTNVTLGSTALPEPGTLALLGSGLALLAVRGRCSLRWLASRLWR
jgi:hypothetical protein